MSTLQYGDLVFDDTFLFAHRGEQELRFTRQERAMLLALTRTPRKLLRRAVLLDSIAEAGSEVSDRNVDFLVNRLRAKLGDAARAPKYIATQYGEGYVWIAERADHKVLEAFLVVGPVFGLGTPTAHADERRFIERLRRALDNSLPKGEKVVTAEGWQPYSGAAHKVRYFVETSFHADGDGLHCAVVLRDMAKRQILRALRLVLQPGELVALDAQADGAAAETRKAVWDHLSRPAIGVAAPTDEPLELKVHGAAKLLGGSAQSWFESGAQLAQARTDNPSDVRTALMWCMHLYSRLVMTGFIGIAFDERSRIEREIETLVFECLPSLQDDPILVLAAAKLLFYIHRGHIDLAEALANEAFAQSTAFAASFPILAQINAARGRFGESVSLYDKAIELAEPGSEYHLYILVLKCTVLLASGDMDAVQTAAADLHAVKPSTRMALGLLTARFDRPLEADLAQVLAMLDAEGARKMLAYLHYNSARHFLAARHRDNVMRPLSQHLRRRFGNALVEDAVRTAQIQEGQYQPA